MSQELSSSPATALAVTVIKNDYKSLHGVFYWFGDKLPAVRFWKHSLLSEKWEFCWEGFSFPMTPNQVRRYFKQQRPVSAIVTVGKS